MPSTSPCPDPRELERFLLGLVTLSDAEAERLEQHLTECGTCDRTAESLKGSDPFVEVLRSPAPLGELPPGEVVDGLIERVSGLKPPAFTAGETAASLSAADPPSGHVTLSHPADPPDKATQEVYDFLAPPGAPGELGRLGSYRVLKVLGAGGMGVVLEAEDLHLQRLVALKAMRPSLAALPSARRRFLREARAMAAIHHDHIVTIHQVGEDRGAPFLAMELLQGETLDDRLQREGRLPVAEVLRIGRETARGLAAAHKRGLVHRDVKPANLWLEEETGRVKILDFGLARATADDSRLTQSGMIIGTPYYMAPEQAAGHAVDVRGDLFSLGCVLYHTATGELPFRGNDAISTLLAVAHEQPRSPRELNPALPPELGDLVMRLLAKKPEDRPPSAQAVAEALAELERDPTLVLAPGQPVAQDAGTGGQAAAGVARSRPTRGRRGFVAVAAALLAVAVLLGVVFTFDLTTSSPASSWLGAVFTFQTKHGTLVVTAAEPDVQVFVDGDEKVTIDSQKVGRVELTPGEHRLTVRRGQEELYTEDFVLKSGGETIIEAKWQVPARAEKAPDPAVDDAWVKAVAALPAQKQVDAVAAKLKDRNPGFDGQVTPTITDDVVWRLEFSANAVTDLSPLRALRGLKELAFASNPGQSRLADLTPLKGLPLTFLDCSGTNVADLTPLKGMKLTCLRCFNTQVADLTPLAGMPLTRLLCMDTQVRELGPLKGLPLVALHCDGSMVTDLSPLAGMRLGTFTCERTQVADLRPLTGLPLSVLSCRTTRVADLAPLKGMQLTELNCGWTEVADLAPLAGMPLTTLYCDTTKVTNLAPLNGMSLKTLSCDFQPERDAALLWSMKTLETINGKPAAKFWKGADAQKPPDKR
jgi:hypothetical protein